jgi:DnaJ-class molecular chaperone with C-terminal Zn finger domain
MHNEVECPRCEGLGFVPYRYLGSHIPIDCPQCNGTGSIQKEKDNATSNTE